MSSTNRKTELQYEGYKKTPLLWYGHALLSLEQLELDDSPITHFNHSVKKSMPLGKYVERFVSRELEQQSNISILKENAQIQNQKITIGEIDCLLKQNNIPIHLEIVFKFYLFDASLGISEIDHWIGPNRNDSLAEKLNKLKDKQLPLIHHQCSKPLLTELAIDMNLLKQRVLFKAQLFIPFGTKVNFDLLNQDCLTGFYIKAGEIHQFSSCEFYIPNKLDWLIDAHYDVEWFHFHQFNENVTAILHDKKSPLCWIKFPDARIQKFFVVWW